MPLQLYFNVIAVAQSALVNMTQNSFNCYIRRSFNGKKETETLFLVYATHQEINSLDVDVKGRDSFS